MRRSQPTFPHGLDPLFLARHGDRAALLSRLEVLWVYRQLPYRLRPSFFPLEAGLARPVFEPVIPWNHNNALFGDRKAFAVFLFVVADGFLVGDLDVFVDDAVADAGFFTDSDILE